MRVSRVLPALILATLTLARPTPASAQTPTSNLQMQLAVDATFVQRVEYLLVQQAHVVKLEGTSPSACSGVTLPPGVPSSYTCHSMRAAYGGAVLASPLQWAAAAAISLVGQVNLLSGVTTTCSGTPMVCTTNATDAAIASQIATIWNALAGAL